jgi:tetratricopeptide (TPR) repeat protein
MVAGVCIFLAVITWVVFGQTVHHDFVNYDDGEYVLKNSQVARGLTFGGITWAFTHVHSSNWHPVTWIAHMLDCQLYGLNPAGHHLSNVLLHSVTAILLFVALRQMTESLWRSAFVAAIFAIHPLRVESVAWVAERKDVLSGLFFILTIWAYARYTRAPTSLRYVSVAVLFTIGLMCKPMVVTLPFVLLLLDYWPLGRIGGTDQVEHQRTIKQLVLEKLPLFGLSVASCAVTLYAQRESMQPVAIISLPRRLANAGISYVDYLRQMFWPSDLAVLYPWEAARLGVARTLPAILVLLGISAIVFLLRRHRYLVTGWLWYLIMLGPVIGLFQVGNQARADRYTYLPQIGLYLILAWASADLCARLRQRKLLLTSAACIVLLGLIVSARAQTRFWRDSEALWSHALACTTDNIVAEGNLGQACYMKGRRREAMTYFENSLRIAPNQAAIHSSLGVLLLEMGRVYDSLEHLETAVKLEPKFSDAHYNLGNTYLEMGQGNEAISQYKAALEIDPNDTQALNNMAWTLATWPDPMIRDGAKAVGLAEQANSLTRGKDSVVSATLAAAYAEAGRFDDAVQAGQRAVQLARFEGNNARADSVASQVELYKSRAAFRDRRYVSPAP